MSAIISKPLAHISSLQQLYYTTSTLIHPFQCTQQNISSFSADQPQDAGHLPLHVALHSPLVGLEALLPLTLPPARPSCPVYAVLKGPPLPLQVHFHLQPQRLLVAPGHVAFPEHALPELLIPDLVYFFECRGKLVDEGLVKGFHLLG